MIGGINELLEQKRVIVMFGFPVTWGKFSA
jgi:hypothetical protein